MYGMKRGQLVLLPYDPEWANDFATERDRIMSATGDDLRIEHVGSTSIPTVHAKPILDIAILVQEQKIDGLSNALTGLGYKFRGQYEDEIGHFYALLDRGNVRFCQVHIYTAADEDWRLKILFRDVLREDLSLALEYDEYKRNLVRLAASKREYAEIKTRWMDNFVLKVLAKAKR